MFVIEIESNPSNKEIYKVSSLLHSRVVFEPPRPVRQVPECGNCQQYGHTKSYCRRCPKCIKCAGDYYSKNCPQQNLFKDVKCVLCDGNHPANHKACLVYQEIKKQKTILQELSKVFSQNLFPNLPFLLHLQIKLPQKLMLTSSAKTRVINLRQKALFPML